MCVTWTIKCVINISLHTSVGLVGKQRHSRSRFLVVVQTTASALRHFVSHCDARVLVTKVDDSDDDTAVYTRNITQ